MIMGTSSFTNDRNNRVASALDLNVGYVQAPEGVYFSGDFSITVWIMYTNLNSSSARILDFSSAGNYRVILGIFETSGCIEFTIFNANKRIVNKATESLRINQLYFLGVVLKDSTAAIYYNGTLKHAGNSYQAGNIPSSDNYIGRSLFNSVRNTNGIIDELKIFNRALTQSDILEEMEAN